MLTNLVRASVPVGDRSLKSCSSRAGMATTAAAPHISWYWLMKTSPARFGGTSLLRAAKVFGSWSRAGPRNTLASPVRRLFQKSSPPCSQSNMSPAFVGRVRPRRHAAAGAHGGGAQLEAMSEMNPRPPVRTRLNRITKASPMPALFIMVAALAAFSSLPLIQMTRLTAMTMTARIAATARATPMNSLVGPDRKLTPE